VPRRADSVTGRLTPTVPVAALALTAAGFVATAPVAFGVDYDPSPNAFVAVELPAPAAWTPGIRTGTVLDVNEDGWACGSVQEVGSSDDLPFVFDPRVQPSGTGNITPRGTMTLLPIGGFASGVANAMIDGAHPIIAGTVTTSGGHTEAVYWEWDAVSETWSMTELFAGMSGPYPSEATGIDFDGSGIVITGHRQTLTSNTEYKSFQCTLSDPLTFVYFPVGGTGSENFSLDVVIPEDEVPVSAGRWRLTGTDRAFYWDVNGADGVHPTTYTASEVTAINRWMLGSVEQIDMVGWARDSSGFHKAVLWRQNANPPILIFSPITDSGADALASDINDHREVVGTFFYGSTDLPIEGFIWTFVDSGPRGDQLSDITRFPTYSAANLITEANAINNRGWIGGAMQEAGVPSPMPCLLIPYDVDNNGVPDYREIVSGDRSDNSADPDFANNWIPDDFEGMRVGLYPGLLDPTQRDYLNRVQHATAVRIHLELGRVHAVARDLGFTEEFRCALYGYGRGEHNDLVAPMTPKEIIVMMRSMGGAPGEEELDRMYDNLPPIWLNPGASITETEALESIALFAHTYARCIDYMQIGNEWLTGPGQYYFRDEDLTGCNEGGLITELPASCYPEAAAKVAEWWGKQLEAARAASALGGRPLRFIAAAVHQGTIRTGFDGTVGGSYELSTDEDNRAALAMATLIDFANSRGAAMDIHVHYVDPLLELEDEALEKIYDPTAPWEVGPELITCMEWSPIPTDAWWDNDDNRNEVRRYFEPTPCDPLLSWDDFISSWRTIDFGGDLGMDTLLPKLSQHTDAPQFLHACYGDFGQADEVPTTWLAGVCDPIDPEEVADPDKFDFTPIRANLVKFGYITPVTRWSNHIKTAFETAASAYPLQWTPPHDGSEACSGCSEP